VALTESLGIALVAEGVEDEPTRAMLIDSGCTLGQGHLYAAAMLLSVAMDWDPGPRRS
jgi:EAL domain-containing protein (putative c-di-GMP-specific phosphodiesterase class I)